MLKQYNIKSMKNIIKTLFIIAFLPSISLSQVVAEGDTVLCDGQQGQVELTLSATSFAVDLTDSGIASDDIFGGVINMDFDFVFYGNTYNQVVLSSNNYLSFNLNNANTGSQWAIGAAIPNNGDGAETMNGILCPWQDIYPGVNGNGIIQYATTGEAPNRVFIASFCGIPMFSCTDICYSSQIKLYETTNIIETHIAQKVLCTTWNDGVAIHGLHNIDGTIAHVVTGGDGMERNFPNQWTCEDDGWRFTPSNDSDYILEEIEFAPAVAGTDIIWQDQFGNNIGNGSEIIVIPGGDVTYTAGASLCGDAGDWCGFEGGIEGDDVIITFEELGIDAEAIDYNGYGVSCYNANNGSIEVFPPSTGEWIYNLFQGDNLITTSDLQNESSAFIFNNLSPDIYSVTIENLSGCVTEALAFILEEPTQILSTTNTNSALCYEDFGSVEIILSGGNAPYTTILGNDVEIISTQNGSEILFNNLTAGDYYYTTSDDNGCLITGDEVLFTIEEPTAIEILINEIGGVTCEDAQNGFIDINIIGGVGNYAYTWTTENSIVSNEEDMINIAGGTYNLVLTDENGCINSLQVIVEENAAINIEGIVTECNSDDGIITTNTNGGTPTYSYNLMNNGDIISSNSSGIFESLPAGLYSVIVSDIFGCESQAEFNLNTTPIADFSINEYEFYLSNTPSEFTDLSNDINIASWLWEFGDGNISNEQNPNHLYNTPGIYYVDLTVTDQEGCTDNTTQTIQILQDYYSYSPTIFTPNNDGINDTFSPKLLNIDINSYKLIIFDRWGKNIFETTNYNEGWNGGLKDGTLVPPDVYSYKVSYKTSLGIDKEETGKLTMVK